MLVENLTLVGILKIIPHVVRSRNMVLSSGINTTCHVLLNIQRLHLQWRVV